MKKWIAFALVLLLLLAVPVSAEGYLVLDSSGLLQSHDVDKLEQVYGEFAAENGFTPAVVTVDDFGGLSAEDFASQIYDVQAYPDDTILLLVSLGEGEWYILLNGEVASRLSDGDASELGERLLPLIRDGQYYAAFLAFPEEALELYEANAPVEEVVYQDTDTDDEPITFFDCYITFGGVGFLAALVVVVIMLLQMRSVSSRNTATDYIIPGSTKLVKSKDIYLYSHTTRRAKPKDSSGGSGGSGRSGSSGGRSRGGAGGRI